MAIDEYKAIQPFAVYDVPSFVPTPASAWSLLNNWAFGITSFVDMFEKMVVSEDCKQETFAEDSSDFA